MNAQVHDNSFPARRPLIVPMQWVGGGLRALLTGRLLPDAVVNVNFVCRPEEGGAYVVEVLANALGRPPGSATIQAPLQVALAQCFLRFWRRAVIEWPRAAPPPETWEWSAQIDGLVCRTRSPEVCASTRRTSCLPDRRPVSIVTPQGRSGLRRYDSSA